MAQEEHLSQEPSVISPDISVLPAADQPIRRPGRIAGQNLAAQVRAYDLAHKDASVDDVNAATGISKQRIWYARRHPGQLTREESANAQDATPPSHFSEQEHDQTHEVSATQSAQYDEEQQHDKQPQQSLQQTPKRLPAGYAYAPPRKIPDMVEFMLHGQEPTAPAPINTELQSLLDASHRSQVFRDRIEEGWPIYEPLPFLPVPPQKGRDFTEEDEASLQRFYKYAAGLTLSARSPGKAERKSQEDSSDTSEGESLERIDRTVLTMREADILCGLLLREEDTTAWAAFLPEMTYSSRSVDPFTDEAIRKVRAYLVIGKNDTEYDRQTEVSNSESNLELVQNQRVLQLVWHILSSNPQTIFSVGNEAQEEARGVTGWLKEQMKLQKDK